MNSQAKRDGYLAISNIKILFLVRREKECGGVGQRLGFCTVEEFQKTKSKKNGEMFQKIRSLITQTFKG